MSQKDVFATPCWNFVGGDRAIEGILRGLPPGAPLVVRNRVANVLPTVAGLADLAGLGARLAVRVPENALYEPALGLDDVYPAESFFEVLLTRLYGIRLEGPMAVAAPGAVLVAAGYGEADEEAAARLAAWLAPQPDLPVVFLCPRGEALAPSLRPHAVGAWSAQRWGGLNAFGHATVEEAVAERRPAQVLVAAPAMAVAAHTAIGAADWFVREDAGVVGARAVRLLAAGARVAVLGFAAAAGPAEAPGTLRALVRRHLERDLGVVSTEADPRVRPTGEAIAIDLA